MKLSTDFKATNEIEANHKFRFRNLSELIHRFRIGLPGQ